MSDDKPTIAAEPRSAPKSRPTKQLPTERVAFSRQLEILRAYAIHYRSSNKPITNEEVASTVQMAATTVSTCNPFLADVGFIQKADGGYIPSQEVINFSIAYDFNAETAATKLAPVLEKTWFAGVIMPRAKFRPIDETQGIGFLAEACNATRDYSPQLRLLLEFLQASGTILLDGGQIRYVGVSPLPEQTPTQALSPAPVGASSGASASTKSATWSNYDRVIPIPLGVGRLAEVRLPEDWNSVKDLSRLLKMLELSLSEDLDKEKP